MKHLLLYIPLLFNQGLQDDVGSNSPDSIWFEETDQCIDDYPCYEIDECEPDFVCREAMPVWIPSIQYVLGDGRSYDSGYGTLGNFLALYEYWKDSYCFLDLELHRIFGGHFAANLGAGWRTLSLIEDQEFGANIYYDLRSFKQGCVHQFGFGFELLGPCWDVRSNIYVPIGNHKVKLSSTTFNFTDDLFSVRNEYKSAMWGVDVEFGRCIWSNCWLDVYGAAGPYCYSSTCCNSFIGGMGRIAVKFTKYVSFQFSLSYDSYFHTKAQGQVYVSFLLPSLVEGIKCAFLPVKRNRIILMEKVCLWDSNF